jgi:hypothetical protein
LKARDNSSSDIKTKLRREVDQRIEKFKKELEVEREKEVFDLDNRYNEKYLLDKAQIRNKSEFEIERIKLSERAKIESTKSDEEELRNNLQEQIADELADYKLELEHDLRNEQERINNQRSRYTKLELNKLKLNLLTEKEQREQSIKSKYTRAKVNVESEYKRKLSSKQMITEQLGEDTKKILNADFNRYKIKLKEDLEFFRTDLLKADKMWENKLIDNLNEEQLAYDSLTQKKLLKITSEANSFVQVYESFKEEFGKVESDIYLNKRLIAHKESELEYLKNQRNDLIKQYNNIQSIQEHPIDHNTDLLHIELTNKNKEIKYLTELLERREHILSLTKPKENLEQLAKHLHEIKGAIVRAGNKKMHKELNEEDVSKAKEVLGEIELFIEKEKAEIKEVKEACRGDYEVLYKLLKSLKNSRNEWGKELKKVNTKGGALEVTKEKLDIQILALSKQASSVQAMMILNDKKEQILKLLELRANNIKNKPNIELIKIIHNLQQEYNSYIKKYKEETNNENVNVTTIESETDEDLIVDISQLNLLTQDFVPSLNRKEELYNIYKNITNYKDVAKKIKERDMLKMVGTNNPKLYDKEIDWLYRMKTEVSKTNFKLSYNFKLY